MRCGLVVWLAAACVATGCTRAEVPPGPGSVSPSTNRVLAEEVVESGPPLSPDPAAVVAAAGAPVGWVRGPERALLAYRVPRGDRRDVGGSAALVLLTSEGEVLGRWASDRSSWASLDWSPAGRAFVGASRYGRTRLLVRPGGITELREERGRRTFRHGDTRFGQGWLLDAARTRIARELLPRDRCGGDVEVDLRGRTWCLDEEKRVVSWTDDHETWTSHQLSTSHLEYCDGGTTGAELELLGDQVVIGLWRADFSQDRGLTWHDVDLPYSADGAFRSGSVPNCTELTTLVDGRLLFSHFGNFVATDASNTAFVPFDFPSGLRWFEQLEGVLVGVRRGKTGPDVSYDGGTTWVPLRVPELLGRLFAEP